MVIFLTYPACSRINSTCVRQYATEDQDAAFEDYPLEYQLHRRRRPMMELQWRQRALSQRRLLVVVR